MDSKLNGLTTEEVAKRRAEGKTNALSPDKSNSVGHIIFKNVFTYFNLIFAVLAVLVVLSGSIKSLTFLPVVIANAIIGIIQQLRAKKVLDELALLDVSEYTVIRDGVDITVKSDELVLGDYIRLESGSQIPADAVVVWGEAAANESLLTGEEDEILKSQGSELKSGSFLTAGSIVAELTAVGDDSYAAKLTKKAKEAKDKKSEMVNSIEWIIKVAGVVIIPVGLALVYQGVYVNGNDFSSSTISMVGAVVGMIPEGLYLLVTIALALSAMRLAQKQVMFHDMRSIETLARVDVLCVDKTGTITSNEMNVKETFSANGELEDDLVKAKELISSYVRTVPDNNITMLAMQNYFAEAKPIEAEEVMPFSSKEKYSQVITKDKTYRLGAPEFLLSSEQMDDNKEAIEQRTGKGLRVLAFVEGTEGNMKPILFVAIHNEIRDTAVETFDYFASQGVEIKVISGDTPLTVSRVAEEAHIEGAENYVDASTLESTADIEEAVEKYTVFGRVKPEQKKEIIQAIKANGKKCAMTGDGVNDILAMKEADCSIAMGAGSDAARQAAQVVLMDSDFSHMQEVVGEGRRNINNITRSATLFLYKNIFSLLLALFSIIGTITYPLMPNQVSLISGFNIGIPAFLLALENNENKQKGKFIVRVLVDAIPAALTSFVAIGALVLFGDLFNIDSADIGTASTYLLSVVGFIILWQICKPITKRRLAIIALCIVGFIVVGNLFSGIFDMGRISDQAAALCVVFAIAEFTVMRFLTELLRRLEEMYYNRRLRDRGTGSLSRKL